jgi:N-acetylglucosaminyldiphosphoundecaprenol N-acetyl-beta-D-mannosaminyltransferase
LGFEQDDRQNELVVDLINRARPDVLCLGLGTPKQEKWAGRFRHRLNVSAILCVGAAFDFASRKARRAPRVIQRAGLEWAFRLIREPRRLWKRYLIGNLSFMFLVIEELRKRKRGRDRGAPKEP